jgi:hypothetical protein
MMHPASSVIFMIAQIDFEVLPIARHRANPPTTPRRISRSNGNQIFFNRLLEMERIIHVFLVWERKWPVCFHFLSKCPPFLYPGHTYGECFLLFLVPSKNNLGGAVEP